MAWLGMEAPPGVVEAAQEMMHEGRSAEALAALEAIVADYPDGEFALRTLGYYYHEVGREVDSVHMLERAVADDPQAEILKNSVYFRTQIALRILEGVPPNGDGLVKTRGFNPI